MRTLTQAQKLRTIILSALASWLVVVGLVWLVMIAPGTTLALIVLAVLMTVWTWRS